MEDFKYSAGARFFEVRSEVVTYGLEPCIFRNIKQLGLFDCEHNAFLFAEALAERSGYESVILYNSPLMAKYISKVDPDRFITVSRPGVGIQLSVEEEVERR